MKTNKNNEKKCKNCTIDKDSICVVCGTRFPLGENLPQSEPNVYKGSLESTLQNTFSPSHSKDWQEEFNEKAMKDWDIPTLEQGEIKSFISSLLASEKAKEMERLKKIKRYDAWLNGFNIDMTNGYNQAINDILSLLTQEEHE